MDLLYGYTKGLLEKLVFYLQTFVISDPFSVTAAASGAAVTAAVTLAGKHQDTGVLCIHFNGLSSFHSSR